MGIPCAPSLSILKIRKFSFSLNCSNCVNFIFFEIFLRLQKKKENRTQKGGKNLKWKSTCLTLLLLFSRISVEPNGKLLKIKFYDFACHVPMYRCNSHLLCALWWQTIAILVNGLSFLFQTPWAIETNNEIIFFRYSEISVSSAPLSLWQLLMQHNFVSIFRSANLRAIVIITNHA